MPTGKSPEQADQLSRAVLAVAGAARPAEFLAKLGELRTEKNLSYDRLGRRCQRNPQLKLSRSGVHKMLTGAQLPERRQLAAYLVLCDVPQHEAVLWRQHLDRVAAIMRPAATQEPAPPVRAQPQPGPLTWHTPRRPPPWQRFMTWHAVCTFAGATLGVAAVLITCTMLRLAPWVNVAVLGGAAAGVTGWALRRLAGPDWFHYNAYVRPDPAELFEPEQLVPPAVIGEER